MKQKICLFLDYLSILSLEMKNQILVKNGVIVVQNAGYTDSRELSDDYNTDKIYQYRNLIRDLRNTFSTEAPNILHSVLQLDNLDLIQNIFKNSNVDFNEFLKSRRENISQIPKWALNGINWFLIETEKSSYEIESAISVDFPVLVFDNIPIEASSLSLIHI